jgi:hypothetical protein
MATQKSQAPILLLQWLDDSETKEIRPAFKSFRREVKMVQVEAANKTEVLHAITSWLRGNPNAQFLYIGSHGSLQGFGPNSNEYITWRRLGTTLRRSKRLVVVWLGACHSSHATREWQAIHGKVPARYVVGFRGKVHVDELRRALRLLLRMTRVEKVIYADQELDNLRRILCCAVVTMHYPVMLPNKSRSYLDVRRFKEKLGITFKEYLHSRRIPWTHRKLDGKRSRSLHLHKHKHLTG